MLLYCAALFGLSTGSGRVFRLGLGDGLWHTVEHKGLGFLDVSTVCHVPLLQTLL